MHGNLTAGVIIKRISKPSENGQVPLCTVSSGIQPLNMHTSSCIVALVALERAGVRVVRDLLCGDEHLKRSF